MVCHFYLSGIRPIQEPFLHMIEIVHPLRMILNMVPLHHRRHHLSIGDIAHIIIEAMIEEIISDHRLSETLPGITKVSFAFEYIYILAFLCLLTY